MKKIIYSLLLILLLSFSVKAQQTNQNKSNDFYVVDLLLFQSPIINKNFYGFSADFKYYLKEKWGTGLNFAIANKKINFDYSYNLVEPDITYVSVGWLNQYDLIQNDKIRIGVNLNNGVAFFNLRDRTQTEIIWDEFGGSSEVPLVKARNVFYVIEPGLTSSFKMASINNGPDVFLTFNIKYRKAIGNTDFALNKDFNGYFVGAGLTLTDIFNY